MHLPGQLMALHTILASLTESRVSHFSTRKGISQALVIGVIVGAIIVGGVVVFIVATSSGTSTTIPYP